MKNTIEHKSFPIHVLSTDDTTGIVEAYVSVMGNIDSGNDRIWKGAFKKTLLERFGQLTVLDNHNSNSGEDVIGKAIEAREVDRNQLPEEMLAKNPEITGALYTKTQYLLDTHKGSEIFKRIKAGALNQYSIGFTVPKGKIDFTTELINGVKTQIRNIREIILYEWSSTIWGMNSLTTTIGVKKMFEQKAVSLSKYIDKLRSTFEQLYLVEVEEGEYKYTTSNFWVGEIFDDYIYVCPSYSFKEQTEYPYYKVYYRYDQPTDEFIFEPQTNWIGGSYQFVEGVKAFEPTEEIKAGKVLSSANQTLVENAIAALQALYEAANKPIDNEEYTSNDVVNEDETKADPPTAVTLDLELQRKRYLEQLQILKLKV
jgi:HK97 family phage prohead protease